MRNRGYNLAIMAAVFLAASTGLWASEHYKVVNGPKDFYYGHISYIEATPEGVDPVVLREGRSVPEPAVLNLPVGPGDTVRTSGDRRLEIQFDSGTIVRLDFGTEVRVETILARSLSSPRQLSNLALNKGRIYVMYKEYDHREMFQMLTPNAAVKLKHNAVAVIAAAEDGSTETQMKYGKARVLFGADEKLLRDHEVGKGERLIIQKDGQSQVAPMIEDTAFELWNKDVNAHFDALHEGLNPLPKPVQKLPDAVFYFAQTYGDLYGEWLWDDYYGYVWRPFLNNGMYPGGWRPYFYGQWSYTGGQMFWVPQEPWGWIPYHLGVWQFDKKHGWVWLPGSMFAPAWATWDFYFGFASWRPWSLYDWMAGPYSYTGGGFNFVDGAWGYNWPFPGGGPGRRGGAALAVVRRDQLMQPAARTFPVPSELRVALKKVTAAYESGDARIRVSAGEIPRQLVFVPKGDIKASAVNEKALTWEQVPKAVAPSGREAGPVHRVADPQREAARLFSGGDSPVVRPQKREDQAAMPIVSRDFVAVPLSSERPDVSTRRIDGVRSERIPTGPAATPVTRFRDWNPDVRIASELGVHIEYSSLKNAIRCPELKISSLDRERGSGIVPNLTLHGVSYGPAGSSGGAYGPSGSSSSGVSSSSGRSERASSGSEGKGEKGKEGGTIK